MTADSTAHGAAEPACAPCDPAAAAVLGAQLGVGPTVGQLLLHRGLATPDAAARFLSPSLQHLSDPSSMVDRDAAAARLARAVAQRERIVVFGDYDVDGTTSTAILTDVLRRLGGEVAPLLANRFDGGYGLSERALERCLALRPAVLVTCDCGSTDHPRVAAARSAGVDVVVIDHHRVPAEPLPALAFLNPHRPDCAFPYKGLASAGLAFSVAAAVRARLAPSLDMRAYLDLVALGTIADVAPLDGDNRALVAAGLRRIDGNACRPGVGALLEAAGVRTDAPIGGRDVSFRLGPRLNAPGRLGDPTLSLELLLAPDAASARALASRIEICNDDRKRIEREGTDAAIEQVLRYAGEAPRHPVLAYSESLHRGTVGITAARLCGRFGVPSFVAALEGDVAHGSARTVDGHDVHRTLAGVEPLLLGFGGHGAAAGFSVHRSNLEALRQALTEVAVAPSPRTPSVELWLGGPFPLPRARDLRRLEPFGERNPAPRVGLRARLERVRPVGKAGSRKLSLLGEGGVRIDAFVAPFVDVPADLTAGEVWVTGHLVPDPYRGEDAVQLEVERARPR